MKTEDQNNSTSAPTDDIDPIGPDRSLLIVDDDGPFLRRLARAMETRGFTVDTAETVSDGIARSRAAPPKYAVVDLRLADGNGLEVIEAIRQNRDDTQIVVLTGYGNIATAVTAVERWTIWPSPPMRTMCSMR
jgi:two-component system, response regulator RegA